MLRFMSMTNALRLKMAAAKIKRLFTLYSLNAIPEHCLLDRQSTFSRFTLWSRSSPSLDCSVTSSKLQTCVVLVNIFLWLRFKEDRGYWGCLCFQLSWRNLHPVELLPLPLCWIPTWCPAARCFLPAVLARHLPKMTAGGRQVSAGPPLILRSCKQVCST